MFGIGDKVRWPCGGDTVGVVSYVAPRGKAVRVTFYSQRLGRESTQVMFMHSLRAA
jgi:hypothetical protein